MGELTTEQALGFIADELCERSVGYNEDHSKGCPQRAIAQAWLAQVRREAKIEALREAARDFEVSTINIQIFGNSPEAELVRVDNAARARFVESLRGRADRLEAGE